ncbi:integral membrane protein [Ophiocordyceps camponoti-floridani]|uniref:Integral membrane protein n=1 Tax=Ophiocordyceps camponoti-floridani TaxID=2030778 RepID=A0A8H4QDG0_9HYPO|nr:integral membrane protein [Ophiocordyceps camponoti-floridani]
MGWVRAATPEVEAQSQYGTIIAICIVLSLLSVSTVSCRLWIRAAARGLAGDDWMAALSMVFALAYSGLCIAQTKYGLGLPIKLRPKPNIIPYTRVNFAGRPIYQLGISFFKVALCISYLRLLKGTDQRTYRRIVWLTIIFIFLAHLGCTLSLIFACTPVAKSWNPLMNGSCLPPGPSFTGYAIVTIVSDIVVALLPVPVLLKLNVRLEKKIGLIAIFMLGLFTTLCSVMRYTQINRIQYGDGNSTMLVLWGTIEFNVGNMVSSLPFLAPVCMKKAKDYRSKYSGGSGGGSHGLSRRKNTDRFKLSDVSNDKMAFALPDRSASHHHAPSTPSTPSTSSTSSTKAHKGHRSIVKSVTYTVKVDKEAADDDDDGYHDAVSNV